MSWIPALLLAALAAGGAVYCVMTVVAARRYLAARPTQERNTEPISILKPLAGADEGLEENLRSFFEQDYAKFEILFGVRKGDDPAVPTVLKLCEQYPDVPAQLIVTGEPPYPNAKIFSLAAMLDESQYSLVVMSDSDIRVNSRFLREIAAEFRDPNLALTTCPYRAVPGASLWSTLEAVGMNTEFLGGVLVARMLEGMKFAVGPTIAARRSALAALGGLESLKDYLAEDFVMGQRLAEKGFGVGLSWTVVEHRIGTQGFRANAAHRLRWSRSTRRSRPYGYIGQVFTNPLPIALLLVALKPAWWPVLLVIAGLRVAAAHATACCVLHDPLTIGRWWLVPLQDMASFMFWALGFFGNTIQWRGRKYYLSRDGRFEPVK
ncbi:MAG: bacteriohopanetetrol glucosamine biosynthesis glycosyltransferase HpnI [Bryobacteraceae bacterium]